MNLMNCPNCGQGIEFFTSEDGDSASCPECRSWIVLRSPNPPNLHLPLGYSVFHDKNYIAADPPTKREPEKAKAEKKSGDLWWVVPSIFFVMSLVQCVAFVMGLSKWVSWPVMIILFPIVLGLSQVPILGQIIGIVGAVNAWGWSVPLSIAFFFWPLIFNLFGSTVFSANVLFSALRKPPLDERLKLEKKR